MKLFSLFLVFVSLVVMGCEADTQGLNERAAIEGRASSEASVQAQNNYLTGLAQQMESELSTRHNFFQAVQGTYEGDLQTSQGLFKIRVTLVPSVHRRNHMRVRQLEEITADFNNLHMNAQIVQWNPANPMSAVGCRIGNIHPDLNLGVITLASENCPNLYRLQIAEDQSDGHIRDEVSQATQSQGLAQDLLEGHRTRIESIVGEVQPSTNAETYHFVVNRI